jgi:hypothetical protein
MFLANLSTAANCCAPCTLDKGGREKRELYGRY